MWWLVNSNIDVNDHRFEALDNPLRYKIESKIDVAKFFAGFISLVLGLAPAGIASIMANPSDPGHPWAILAFLMLIFSLCMSVVTLFAYDRLLMPPKLWFIQPDNNSYKKDLKNLKEDMLNAWKWLFFPSVVTLILGLICLIIAVTKVLILIIPLIIVCLSVVLIYLIYLKRSKTKIFCRCSGTS